MPLRFLPLLLALSLLTLPAAAQDSDDQPALDEIPHITLVGTATAEVKPDIALITLGVVTQRSSARDAAAETARKTAALLDAAKAQGLGGADIATQALGLTETFDDLHDPQGRYIGRKQTGFSAENIITLKLRDLAKAGAVAQALIEAGANRLDGISFAVEHPEPILDRLTGEAVRRAKAQATIAAEAAGMKLGPALLIRNSRDGGDIQRPSRLMLQSKAATPAAMPIEAGTNTLAQSVEVSFALKE